MEGSRVFVTQVPARYDAGQWAPTVDISPAKDFGEITVLFPSGMNLHAVQPGSDTEKTFIMMAEEFNPHRDFLLPVGDTLLMMTAAAVLGSLHSHFRILKWDRRLNRYYTYGITTQYT